jgi:hypothetical protein
VRVMSERSTRDVSRPGQRRTALGKRLDEIRERIKASGEPLLSWEEIDREIAEHRSEARTDDDD